MLKPNLKQRLIENEAISVAMGIVDVPLKEKYRCYKAAKFGGTKHKMSNGGKVGRAARREKRKYIQFCKPVKI